MKKTVNKSAWITLLCAAALLAAVTVLENVLDPNKNIMVFTALKKGAVYALVAVSMNLLNGFTGLFSLGQAGFMLLGAYTYAILTIPAAQKEAVYYIYNGSAIGFSLPELLGGGPVGLETLAAAIGEDAGTLEDVYEPYLVQNGLLIRTPRGRMVSDAAYLHFGLKK